MPSKVRPLPIVSGTTEPDAVVRRIPEAMLVIARLVEVALVRVVLPVNVFAPVNLLLSARSVDDANDQVEVAAVYTLPEASVTRRPFVKLVNLSVLVAVSAPPKKEVPLT